MYYMTNSDVHTITQENWFALEVKRRHEQVIAQNLQYKGFEAFTPSCRRKASQNKVVNFSTPLFPGYVFSMFDARFRLPILMTPGVRSIAGYGRIPIPIDSEEINAIRNIVNFGIPVEPCPYLSRGKQVRVTSGPLIGVRGFVLQTRSPCRIVVSVSLIQQSIRIEVDRDMLVLDEKDVSGSIRFAS